MSCHRQLNLHPKFLHISHRENGSFEVLSLHPRRLQLTAVSCKRSICNKIERNHESHLSEVFAKVLYTTGCSFRPRTFACILFLDFLGILRKTTRILSIATRRRKNSMPVSIPCTSSRVWARVVVSQLLGVNGLM